MLGKKNYWQRYQYIFSDKSLQVSGKVFLVAADSSLPDGSCLQIRVRADIKCDDAFPSVIPSGICMQPRALGEITIKDPIFDRSDNSIQYSLNFKERPNTPSYLVEATLNKGWCYDESASESKRTGDYHNDYRSAFAMQDGALEAKKDIDIVEYAGPSGQIGGMSIF